ncbi:uncharacterized protein KY384_008006 [Bacidia gigantensis]|uniref:uncharacterized protein n=1 Tax=Bacidia gigantensis TaxID=2732470 RepID=UPI001D043988|nr:uncharacterized protein KY384_008006 [Bacidia gigantensis]KAG8527262.1 hypothetical protein KY384_008006 [Bacidia gigantensis]
MSVLPEGPIWFQHESLKRPGYDPADPDQFYNFMLVEVVVNKETAHKQGIMGWQYHLRTKEHIVGYEPYDCKGIDLTRHPRNFLRTLDPGSPNTQVNYKRWQYMSVMYGPEAKTLTKRIKMTSAVSRGDMIGKGAKAPRVFLVPVPMPNSAEQYVWFDLTFPLRAIYLPRQHQVDGGANKEWCIFQHLSFRLRSLGLNAYVKSGEKAITAEERNNFTVSMDNGKYSSGDDFLLKKIETLSDPQGNNKVVSAVEGLIPKSPAANSTKSVSELKDMRTKADPSLRQELEKKMAELCEVTRFTRNNANKAWAAKYGELQAALKVYEDRQDEEIEKTRQELQAVAKSFGVKGGDVSYVNIMTALDRKAKVVKAKIRDFDAQPHEPPLKEEEEKALQEKNKTFDDTMTKTRQIDRELQDARKNRLKMNTYNRQAVTLNRDEQLGWGIRKGWIARFDPALIYHSTMIPRGWLLDEYQSPYSGVDIFDEKSIDVTFEQQKDEEIITMNEDRATDLAEMLSKEWGARLTYDDTPIEPDFVWGVVNSIAQIGLGLIPGWGPLLVYGETVLYNLIFTDSFSKIASGDGEQIKEISAASLTLLVESRGHLSSVVRSRQASDVQALIIQGVR